MKQKILSWAAAILFVGSFGGALVTTATPNVAYAADDPCVKTTFLTLPPWYRGLTDPNTCEIVQPTSSDDDALGKFTWKIVLNIIDMALQVVGYMAVGFIIYGGFAYMTSEGEPEGSAKARRTIRDAIVGLVIAIGSVGIVNLVMGIIG